MQAGGLLRTGRVVARQRGSRVGRLAPIRNPVARSSEGPRRRRDHVPRSSLCRTGSRTIAPLSPERTLPLQAVRSRTRKPFCRRPHSHLGHLQRGSPRVQPPSKKGPAFDRVLLQQHEPAIDDLQIGSPALHEPHVRSPFLVDRHSLGRDSSVPACDFRPRVRHRSRGVLRLRTLNHISDSRHRQPAKPLQAGTLLYPGYQPGTALPKEGLCGRRLLRIF